MAWFEQKLAEQGLDQAPDDLMPREEIAELLAKILTCHPEVSVVMGPESEVGPLGGHSEKITAVITRGKESCFVTLSVYGNRGWVRS